MQTQNTTKTDKRAARRRNRNKRRRKLRQQRKLKANLTHSNPPGKKKVQSKLKVKKSPEEISKTWEALCLETYQRLTTWQSEAQLNFWKARTEWLQKENKNLKEQLDKHANNHLNIEKETKTTASVDDDNETNASYLEFIAITRKHREELRQKREKQSEENSVD